MKISFDNQSLKKLSEINKSYTADSGNVTRGIGSSYAVNSAVEDSNSYEGKKISVSDFKDRLKDIDVKNTQDYMTFMAHSVSEEDFSKMMEEGELPMNVPAEDMVTIVDRIKLAVAKSGKEIKGYTDTLDEEKIYEMTGSRSMEALAKSKDVSLDEETLGEIKEALDMMSDVKDITDGMKKFLIQNNCELTIDNLYIARHSACENVMEQGSDYFSIEAKGYLAKKGSDASVGEIKEEVSKLLVSMEMEPEEELVEDGKWLVDNSILLNEENLKKLEEIKSVKLPLGEEEVSKSILAALEEGKNAKDANVTKTESIYDEAVRLTKELASVLEKPFIKATRILEETRLKMTAEANLMLLKSGVKIETKDIEVYVEALKKMEANEEVRVAVKTEETLSSINRVKEYPAQVIGMVSDKIATVSVEEIAAIGKPVMERLNQANVEYEKVATTVRRDLGDSIKKAFRNVPDILESMGLETSEENKRAVRILGYNSMPITKESIKEVREADRKLLHALMRLTPSDTIKLIKDGKSPIKMSIDELNQYLDTKHEPKEEEIEKYSKFLYKLERDKNILPEERREYIEVYRLINSLNKTDDAAVGNIISTGMQFTFENLLTSQKAAKAKGIDVRIREEYDNVIAMDEELEKAWQSEKYKELREAMKASEETVTELVMNNAKVTPENLEAALLLRKRRGEAFRKATEANGRKAKAKALSISDNLSKDSKDDYMNMIEECKSSVYEECMNSDTYMDVRALKLVHRQLSVAKTYAFNENYEVPMEIGGEVSSVNVKLVHNLSEEPNVVVCFETKELGRVSARFTKTEEEINGYIACNLKETVTKMEKAADILGKKVSVVFSKNSDTDLTLSRIPMKDNSDDVSATELYTIAKQFLASMKGL